MQSVVQRAINALAAQESGEVHSASEALAEDASKALINESDLTEKILSRFQTTSDVGTRILPLVKKTLASLATSSVSGHLIDRVTNLLARSSPSQFQYLESLEKQGLKVMMTPEGAIGLFDPPNWSLRAGDFKSPLKEKLLHVLGEADSALSTRWKICRICGRPFPQGRATVAKACPVCRRKYETPLRLHRRLKNAPMHPVVFQITPPTITEPLWLVIAPGVHAPPAIRRIVHAPLTPEEKAPLEAALRFP